jgi:adenylate cyclase
MGPKSKNTNMRHITFLIGFGNGIGAALTYLYFSSIYQAVSPRPQLPAYYDDLFFIIATGALIAVCIGVMKNRFTHLYQIASGEVPIENFDRAYVPALKKKAIQLPAYLAIFSLLIWVLAGFIFGLIEPVITQLLFGVAPPSLVRCLLRFFGIVVIGGSVTTIFIYFTLEKHWREVLPKFFPEGNLNQVKDAFKLHVQYRLLAAFVAISLVPLPLLGIVAYLKAQMLHHADALTRTALLSDLSLEIIVITIICVAFSILLSVFVSKSVSRPLHRIEAAMKSVAQGNLDVQVEIESNDEIGSVAEGFNLMLKGLKASEAIKESFGKYVSREIRDEILAGRISLDGEMTRATLLFSDLRNFTPFVESTHPKQVVSIMNQYFTQMSEAIKANRGLVLQYVGDEIEAVFGTPVSYSDHTDRAIMAALEMRQRLKLLNQSFVQSGFKPFSHGIGIHTGAVLAGNIGSKDRISYALVGDTVNSASRIQGLTKEYACDIILSQTTHDLLAGHFRTEQLSDVKVKGKQEKLLIYKLIDRA